MVRLVGIAICLLAVAAAGCAPKRVGPTGVITTGPPETAPATSGSAAPPPGSLPDPEPIGRSGTGAVPRPQSAPTGLGPRAASLAEAQLGKPYQWGAAGPDKFDCSGLVQYVYSNLGVPLPRVSRQQASAGVHVDREDLQPGDLVFFVLSGSRIDHVGIYLGRGKFIHAPRRYSPVRTDSLNNSWWRRRFKGGRRIG